jgi:uncharacterized protein YkwD
MRIFTSRRLRRLALPAVAACGLAAASPAPAGAASPCGGSKLPSELTDATLRWSTVCLINAERTARGVRPLRLDRRLGTAARRHSQDMVAKRYFAHESRSGARFSARIARTGWMNGRGAWSVGENIAWGSGTQATPRSIVAGWMRSAGHRHNILNAKFHVIGLGIARRAPVGNDAGATYTTDFGS